MKNFYKPSHILSCLILQMKECAKNISRWKNRIPEGKSSHKLGFPGNTKMAEDNLALFDPGKMVEMQQR